MSWINNKDPSDMVYVTVKKERHSNDGGGMLVRDEYLETERWWIYYGLGGVGGGSC